MASDQTLDTTSRVATLRTFGRVLQRELRAKGWGNPFGYLFILPAMLLYGVFSAWPIFRGFIMSFTDYRFLYPDSRWDFNGIQNFVDMFSDQWIGHGLIISIKWTLLVQPTVIIVSLLLAVLISRVNHGQGFYRWIVYLPTILPIAVTLLMFGQFYNARFGFLNVNLRNLGIDNPPRWLNDTRWALPALAFTDVWRGFGFPTLLFLIGIYNINSEIYEAAAIDGATAWHQFWRITMPLLKPTFMLILVLGSGIAGGTEPALILTSGGPQNATRSIGLYLYQVAFTLGDMRLGYSAAVGLLLGILSALLSLFWFRLLKER